MLISRIGFLCSEHELDRERRGYFKALRRQEIEVFCLPRPATASSELLELPSDDMTLLLQPDVARRLPHGLVNSKIPTACFSIDTFHYTSYRTQISMLFDYAFVFHPGFDEIFQKAGHPKAYCLPHAVECELFDQPELERIYDIGWVGRLDGEFYKLRRRVINVLKSSFTMNDIGRYYNPEEMAQIYRQSKIVINLSRDDYLKDANLRCFEVMAAGALLITPIPSELSSLGFTEGLHYIAFKEENELYELVEFYLNHPQKRNEISNAARSLVLGEHTYDNRAQTMLGIVEEGAGKLFAPARHWEKSKIHKLYFGYWSANILITPMMSEWMNLVRLSPVTALRLLPTVVKLCLITLKIQLSLE